jgi:hypothetical protein
MKPLKTPLLLVALLVSGLCTAQTTNFQVFSLFVINIAKYSSWPTQNGEIHIVVFGKSKVYDELLKQNGRNLNGQSVRVTTVENVAALGHPNIVYLPDSKSSSLDEVMKATEGKPVLIIGEREGLFRKGAGFSFIILENGTLRYDINATELEKRSIKVSKNLTSLANSSI